MLPVSVDKHQTISKSNNSSKACKPSKLQPWRFRYRSKEPHKLGCPLETFVFTPLLNKTPATSPPTFPCPSFSAPSSNYSSHLSVSSHRQANPGNPAHPSCSSTESSLQNLSEATPASPLFLLSPPYPIESELLGVWCVSGQSGAHVASGSLAAHLIGDVAARTSRVWLSSCRSVFFPRRVCWRLVDVWWGRYCGSSIRFRGGFWPLCRRGRNLTFRSMGRIWDLRHRVVSGCKASAVWGSWATGSQENTVYYGSLNVCLCGRGGSLYRVRTVGNTDECSQMRMSPYLESWASLRFDRELSATASVD